MVVGKSHLKKRGIMLRNPIDTHLFLPGFAPSVQDNNEAFRGSVGGVVCFPSSVPYESLGVFGSVQDHQGVHGLGFVDGGDVCYTDGAMGIITI